MGPHQGRRRCHDCDDDRGCENPPEPLSRRERRQAESTEREHERKRWDDVAKKPERRQHGSTNGASRHNRKKYGGTAIPGTRGIVGCGPASPEQSKRQ